MYLQKIQLQGFKSFVKKTTLEFASGITAIVGPNGSGKTNIVEAIRWVLGEQSIKLLRGKRSEDIIFAGSDKKAQLGFAEVNLYLNNEDRKAPIDYQEIVITRRLYRDGESEYLINKSRVRLQDILLLLAKAHFGQRSYSIIGQGMTDAILSASPETRKGFFEEAAGVKEYQIKQEEAINKLEKTKENLSQAELILQEITPRLRSLTRQVKKLERREEVEKELQKLQKIYYGGLFQKIESGIKNQELEIKKIKEQKEKLEREVEGIQKQLESLEKEAVESEGFSRLQKKYEELIEQKNILREKIARINMQIFMNENANKKKPAHLPISQIIKKLEEIQKNLSQIEKIENIEEIKSKNRDLKEKLTRLIEEIKHPSLKNEVPSSLLKDLKETKIALEKINENLKGIQEKISSFGQREEEKRKEIFDLQRKNQAKQNELNENINQLNEIKIGLARLETKKEDLEKEMKEENIERISNFQFLISNEEKDEEELQDEIHKLKHQLELIGGIDPEVVKEYKEIKERHEFLDGQSIDLKKAIESLEKVINQLDETIKKQFESAFKKINEEFERYFKILFGGGRAKLILLKEETPVLEEESFEHKIYKINKAYKGVEIYATPPGKRLKNINMLSGGEKALTSLALICAIIHYTISPFVVLDEVDATLDEANSAKFAKILEDLSHKIQFIVITHNRTVMEKAKVLYGVTMEDEGISKLLSVKIEDVKES